MNWSHPKAAPVTHLLPGENDRGEVFTLKNLESAVTQTCRQADMIHIVTLICWHGVMQTICQAVVLTYCHVGLGQTNMLARCHAKMQKSGHAAGLSLKPGLEEVS